MSTDTELLPPPQLVPSAYSMKVGETLKLTCKIDVKPDTHVELHLIYKQPPDDVSVSGFNLQAAA